MNIGNTYASGPRSEETKQRMRKPKSEEHKRNLALAKIGNINGRGNKGKFKSEQHKRNMRGPKSKEHILNSSIARMKPNFKYEYHGVWYDLEYREDLRKDYCENKNCKKISKQLHNHHIFLDKKKCTPKDVMTLCNSCHQILHWQLRDGQTQKANSKDFIIINRLDHVTYIYKSTRKIVIRIEKVIK